MPTDRKEYYAQYYKNIRKPKAKKQALTASRAEYFAQYYKKKKQLKEKQVKEEQQQQQQPSTPKKKVTFATPPSIMYFGRSWLTGGNSESPRVPRPTTPVQTPYHAADDDASTEEDLEVPSNYLGSLRTPRKELDPDGTMSEAELTELEEADYEKALLEMQANYEMKFQANQENSIQLQKDSAARFQSTMVQLGSSSKNFFTKKKTFSSKKKPAPKEHLVPDIVPQRLPFESPNVAATPNCDAKPRRAKTQREVTQAQKTRMVHDAAEEKEQDLLVVVDEEEEDEEEVKEPHRTKAQKLKEAREKAKEFGEKDKANLEALKGEIPKGQNGGKTMGLDKCKIVAGGHKEKKATILGPGKNASLVKVLLDNGEEVEVKLNSVQTLE
mmetsp:Transcript_2292/g.3772  ORF Transcript_2292/g.3772 Transcript_2292/m.3772 type:complete len:384 (-) Transcript_2292:139-1290(-)